MANNQSSDFRMSPEYQKIKKHYKSIITLVVLAILAFSAFFQIGAEEVGVITRFGKHMRTVGSGLKTKVPFIEQVYKVPVERQNKQEFGFRTAQANVRTRYQPRSGSTSDEALMLTGDLNLANVQWVVQYRIDQPHNYLFKVRNAESTLRDISEAVMRQVVGDRTVNEVLTVGRAEVASQGKKIIQDLSREYTLGIQIAQVVLQDVNPPDPVKEAFNAVNEAQQEKETLINQAKSEYNKIIPKARGQAEETIQKAEGYATRRVNTAQGEVARFNALYREYVRAPEVTKRRIYLETLQDVIPKLGDKIITPEEGNNMIPLLQMQLKQNNQ
ncbi:MAG: FtsH protease activity modulator HflK [Bacteroidales bacterium]|nr:FtsH protease activity modulator HflK [Bacteroidales bacterium]